MDQIPLASEVERRVRPCSVTWEANAKVVEALTYALICSTHSRYYVSAGRERVGERTKKHWRTNLTRNLLQQRSVRGPDTGATSPDRGCTAEVGSLLLPASGLEHRDDLPPFDCGSRSSLAVLSVRHVLKDRRLAKRIAWYGLGRKVLTRTTGMYLL